MKKKEKIEHYTNVMKEIADLDDVEQGHLSADKLMCDILEEHGYKELVNLFYNMTKWYS